MTEEKKKQWLVTLPYDDVRGMEARCELLSEIKNKLIELKSHVDEKFIEHDLLEELVRRINNQAN